MQVHRSNAIRKAAPAARRDLRTAAGEWRNDAIKARASNDDFVLPVPGEDGPQSGSRIGRRVCFVLVWIAAVVVVALRVAGLIV